MARRAGSAREIFGAFLRLGLTSFGGPIAHIGYFRDELVTRRGWVGEKEYADLVALCQFLPGPASSQVGFALGLQRGGPLGALAAWLAFTLPSAVALVAFAWSAGAFGGPTALGVVAGLKVLAVAIVAQAVLGMGRSLCPDRRRRAIALGAAVIALVAPGSGGQIGAILAGALAAGLLLRGAAPAPPGPIALPVSRRTGAAALALFFLLLLALPLVAGWGASQTMSVIDAFYRAGALVFGGGHVVLPLLDAEIVQPGWIPPEAFLAGYGAAQAVPGPLFSFAAYLGALLAPPPAGLAFAALALVAIFLPGLLLLVGVIPFWRDFSRWGPAASLMAGANAAVVGILAAALYDPIFTTAISGPGSLALALIFFALLTLEGVRPWVMVIVASAIGAVAL